MQGYRFYLEYADNAHKRKGTVKRPGAHLGTVVAVSTARGYLSGYGNGYCLEGVGGVLQVPNSSVCSTSVSPEYLLQDCRRIPEALAREIHPVLFAYLESE